MRLNIIVEFVDMHKIYANNVIIQLTNQIYFVRKLFA